MFNLTRIFLTLPPPKMRQSVLRRKKENTEGLPDMENADPYFYFFFKVCLATMNKMGCGHLGEITIFLAHLRAGGCPLYMYGENYFLQLLKLLYIH